MPDTVVIELDIGSDFTGQIFWTDEYNDPVPLAEPVLMDVKDGNGQIALRFSPTADPVTDAYIEISPYNGFFQLSCPRALTATLVPGRYSFDLWACVADSAGPFDRQVAKVLGGYLHAIGRVTVMEAVSAEVTG